MPTLFCLNKTGPLDVLLMATDMINSTGDNTARPINDKIKSITRLPNLIYIRCSPHFKSNIPHSLCNTCLYRKPKNSPLRIQYYTIQITNNISQISQFVKHIQKKGVDKRIDCKKPKTEKGNSYALRA